MANRPVITISRQYGSGGRLIGQKLAQALDIPFYDKELITLAAKKSGYDEEIFKSVDEQASNSLLYTLAMDGNVTSGFTNLPLNDQLFMIQSGIIRDLAKQGPCVIVGRCADYVLSEEPDVVNVFIYADLKARMERAVSQYGLPQGKAEVTLVKTDKRRATYYNYYSGKKWGRAENYHLCLDSGRIGLDASVDVIRTYLCAAETK
ncbi:MAG: cytidylate kinase-like family protein [Eubacteriales bacterium]|nr:cytidylate kinase-like family protein [Eubacteriales bacterium]